MRSAISVGLGCLLMAKAIAAGYGSYAPTFSGGRIDVIGPSGTQHTVLYGPTGTDSWGASAQSTDPPPPNGSGQAGTGSCTGYGDVTAQFIWSGGSTDTQPVCVVVKTTITVTRVGESGAVDNGIGDPEATFSGGGTSTGVYYSIKNNPGNSFSLTYSPSGLSVLTPGYTGPPALSSAHLSVSVTSVVLIPTLMIDGAQQDGRYLRWLIGQETRLRLLFPEGSLSNFWYTVPKPFFCIVGVDTGGSPHPDYRIPILADNSTYQQPAPTFAQSRPVNPALNNFAGSATLTIPGELTGTIVSRRTAQVDSPTLFEDPNHSADFSDSTLLLPDAYSPTSVEVDNDVTMRCKVSVPNFYASTSSFFIYAQIVALDRYKTWTTAPPTHLQTDDALDGTYPYNYDMPNNGITPADGVTYDQFDDRPTSGLVKGWPFPAYATYFEFDDLYDLHVVFRPYVRSGLNSYDVTIRRISWQWDPFGTQGSPWSMPHSATPYKVGDSSGDTLAGEPRWTSRYAGD